MKSLAQSGFRSALVTAMPSADCHNGARCFGNDAVGDPGQVAGHVLSAGRTFITIRSVPVSLAYFQIVVAGLPSFCTKCAFSPSPRCGATLLSNQFSAPKLIPPFSSGKVLKCSITLRKCNPLPAGATPPAKAAARFQIVR